jgi:hypothetical protein
MPDGRILMIVRGSNETMLEKPGAKWYSISADEGATWTAPQPWTDTDGALCYSPSSCSQLLQHSNGNYYWLGNLTPENPQGSYPRYPLVVAQVDPHSLKLIRESVFIIDTSQPGEELPVMLSSFVAHEDRETGDILVYLSRVFPDAPSNFWTSTAYLYRIEL